MNAINICANEAETIEFLPENTVLISINDDNSPLVKLKLNRQNNNILTVIFSDVTAPVEHRGQTFFPIDQKTALKILNFININKEKNFIVHCRAGVSRSAAICLYLHLFHDHELKDLFWKLAEPNSYVLGKLIIEKNRKLI